MGAHHMVNRHLMAISFALVLMAEYLCRFLQNYRPANIVVRAVRRLGPTCQNQTDRMPNEMAE